MARQPTTVNVKEVGGKFKVPDAGAKAGAAWEFEVVNDTDHTILVALPEQFLPADPERPKRKQRIVESLAAAPADFLARAVQIERGRSKTFQMPARDAGEYPYEVAVFPPAGTEPAEGNSPPKIIIDA